ncbi:MAG: hypothetical protein KKH84_01885, partial [Proteobacteria bacterium]|nr:hypothetical protein [Pseudomonadota bacterium]MBU4287501.1 hypothetical protein [Pseudomonadota bacterium]MBU4419739.1 hypothetical protein [Pseudomonadota bacterium]MCG2758506.1 hypothetical protein [Desulfobacteraceae bacterium]
KKTVFKNNFVFPILSLAFLIMFIYAFIPPNQSKAYITIAGKWLKQNMPQQSKLYTNSPQLSYYSGKKFIEWDVSDNLTIPQWSSDDFVALKTKQKHYEKIKNTLSSLELKPGKTFANKEEAMIVIFEFIKDKSNEGSNSVTD